MSGYDDLPPVPANVARSELPGIAAAEREKVFTPFYRAAAALESNPSGTGLGLAIVRDVAALHGATIALDDADTGTGLKVSIVFPLLQRGTQPH